MFLGGGKNFFSREKKFFPPPSPLLFQEKRGSFAPVGRKTGNTLSATAKGTIQPVDGLRAKVEVKPRRK